MRRGVDMRAFKSTRQVAIQMEKGKGPGRIDQALALLLA
jgi:hypothetical protein